MLCPWGYRFPRWPPPPRPSSFLPRVPVLRRRGWTWWPPSPQRLPLHLVTVPPLHCSPICALSTYSPSFQVADSHSAKCLPARAAFLKPPRLVPSYLDNHAGVRAEGVRRGNRQATRELGPEEENARTACVHDSLLSKLSFTPSSTSPSTAHTKTILRGAAPSHIDGHTPSANVPRPPPRTVSSHCRRAAPRTSLGRGS